MGQATTIVLANGQDTPSNVTFYPEMVSNGTVVYVDRRKSIRTLQPSFTLGWSPATAQRPTYRVPFSFDYPIEGEVNGIPARVGTMRFRNGDFIIPDNAPESDRKDFRAFVANALDAALVKGYITSYDPIYG